MKRTWMGVLAAAALLWAGNACADWADGSYQDAGEGYRGQLVATVTVRDGRVQAVTAESRADPPDEYLQTALDGMAAAIVQTNGIEGVDAVTGATGSSNGIREAVTGALKQAAASVEPANGSGNAAAQPSASPTARPTVDPEKAERFLGLGSAANFREGPGKDETDVPVYSFNVAMAAALFDREGRILDVQADVYEVSTPNYDGASMPHFSGWPDKEGYNVVDPETKKVTGVSVNTVQNLQKEVAGWVTKRERGDSYGMNPQNEWYRQMDAYEQWMIGRTTQELRSWFARYTSERNGRPIKESSDNADDKRVLASLSDEQKKELADVVSMATMSLSDSHGYLLEAIEKAYENRVPVGDDD